MSEPLPLQTQTSYAELLERLIDLETRRSIGQLSGSFVTKEIGAHTYYYYQASLPGGSTRQIYLGKRSKALDAVIARAREERAGASAEAAGIGQLCSMLRAGGAQVADGPSARVIRALAEAGVFRLGGVLVGTHAFMVLGNLLGVRWIGTTARTDDIDPPSARERDLDIALPDSLADVPTALERLELGFMPVLGLDPRRPSTSFKVRGKPLRVDLLTPRRRNEDKPVPVPRFRAAAQPIRHLDILLESTEQAAVIDGGATLVNVPSPAHFALHKLIVALSRPAAFHTKSRKDMLQASAVLRVLLDERPGDIARAAAAIERRGRGTARALKDGVSALASRDDELASRVRSALRSEPTAR